MLQSQRQTFAQLEEYAQYRAGDHPWCNLSSTARSVQRTSRSWPSKYARYKQSCNGYMATVEEAKVLFAGWSVRELQDYIREGGGNPNNCVEKRDLVETAARLSVADAQNQISQQYQQQQRTNMYPGSNPYGTPGGGYPPPNVTWGQAPAGGDNPWAQPPPAAGAPPNPFGNPPGAAAAAPYGQPYAPPAASTNPYGAPPATTGAANPYGAPPTTGANPYGAPPATMGAANPYGGPPTTGANPYGAPQAAAGVAAGAQAYGVAPVDNRASHGVAQPSPYSHMPPAGAPMGGNKKALIIGCNYPGTQSQLRGCINDAQCMEYMLKAKYGFKAEDIRLLRDDQRDPYFIPTKLNILNWAKWLTTNNPPGSSLVFHFSGHGSQQRDYSGEEGDGMNETILPTDFKTAGQIVDDQLNNALCNPIPAGVKLHAVIDACHSGTALDLPYRCQHSYGSCQWKQEYDPRRLRSWKGTAGGRAVQISAANDHQVAADTNALSGGTHTGAATFSFIQAVERAGGNISYGQLLTEMHRVLDKGASSAPPAPSMSGGGGLLSMLLGGSMSTMGMSAQRGQTPVLSANEPFDLNERFML